MKTTKNLVTMGLLIALSMILSRFPVYGTIGLDSLPAFFGAVLLGPLAGGLLGAMAHLMVALLQGFPFSIPAHLLVAVMMFISCYAFGAIRGEGHKIARSFSAILVAVIINGPLALGLTALLLKWMNAPFSGMPMVLALLPLLSLTATVNVAFAEVLYRLIGSKVRQQVW